MKEGEGRSLSGACVSFYRGRMEVVVEVAGRGGGGVWWFGQGPRPSCWVIRLIVFVSVTRNSHRELAGLLSAERSTRPSPAQLSSVPRRQGDPALSH